MAPSFSLVGHPCANPMGILRAFDGWLHIRGDARNFPTGGLILPTRELKHGFQGTINAKTLRKVAFQLPKGGSILRRG